MKGPELRLRQVRWWLQRLPLDGTGSLMVEAVLAVTLFAMVGTAVLVGLSTTHNMGAEVEEHSIAENLARNQMEHMFSLTNQDPPSTYPSVSVPMGYTISAAAEEYVTGDSSIEKVVVQVSHGAEQVLTLETLRVK